MPVSLKMSRMQPVLLTQNESMKTGHFRLKRNKSVFSMKTLIIVSSEMVAGIKKHNVTNRIIDVKERFL